MSRTNKNTALNIQSTRVFELLTNSENPIVAFQGSARAGKTYNIILWFVVKLLGENNKVFTIVRDSLPSIKGSVLRDFIDVLNALGIYKESNHNKTEATYMIGTNLVEFVSADQPHRIRGRKRDYLFINEASELDYDAWMQLNFRTTGKVVLDYNPSMVDHWIYTHVIDRPDVDFHIVTYKDNPFLEQRVIDEIERLKDADEEYWKVYGLGERGSGRELIFTHWKICEQMPAGDYFYGCDFGFNHKTALIRCTIQDEAVYAEELVYESRLTTTDLANTMKGLQIDSHTPIYYDYADPRSAEELSRHGFYMQPCATKDVKQSIMSIKAKPLFVTRSSSNLIKELKNYSWKKDKTGMILDEPVKYLDDAVDALRYAVSTNNGAVIMSWTAF
jgi:phage terminase, large subunit, PBSX family